MGEKIVQLEMDFVNYSKSILVDEHEENLSDEELNHQEKLNKDDNILNYILPPKQWIENGNRWLKKVSDQPATRTSVMQLIKALDISLRHLQARKTGICPIRRALYSQCFDEMIRQVTIDCTERGLLLMKIRDELKMTMDAYRKMYESGRHFGEKKYSYVTPKQLGIENSLIELEAKRRILKNNLERNVEIYEKARRQKIEQLNFKQKNDEEINFLNKSNQQIKSMIRGFVTPNDAV